MHDKTRRLCISNRVAPFVGDPKHEISRISVLPSGVELRDYLLLVMPRVVEAVVVPADLLVYTACEWQALRAQGGRFARVLMAETVWLLGRRAW